MKKTIVAGIMIPAIMFSVVSVGSVFAMTSDTMMKSDASMTSDSAMKSDEAMMTSSANLHMGSRGSDVVSLQTFLETKGFLHLNGIAKGYYGARTAAALKRYHEDKGDGMMSSAPRTDTKAADLRVLLNALEREHVDLASAAVRAGFDGAPSFNAAAGQLDQNSVEISKAVGSIYGADAEAKFLQIWRSHIGFFVDYTVAAKKGDKAGMDKAVANLGGYVDAISDFFSGANPNLPREAVHQLVSAHVGLLKAAVDTYGAGDAAGSYKNQHDANNQIGTIADAISGAIVKQYPAKF
jgi:hypothetical protein